MTEKTINGIPQIGFGSGGFKGDDCYNVVGWALAAGYRHIDTAQRYKNEAEVGRAIANSGIARDEIFITTKIHEIHYGVGELLRATEQSLEKLGGPVDLLLLHWPSTKGVEAAEQYIGELCQIFDDGLAKRIGLSNFTIDLLDEAKQVFGTRKIAANQCEIHAYMQNSKLTAHCKSLDIPMIAFCPMGRGMLADEPILAEIGKNHRANATQIALAYLLNLGHIVIPSSSSRQRIIANFAARNIELNADEMQQIKALDRGLRVATIDWDIGWDEKTNIERLARFVK
uniref:Aldo/keto reductase n=1 Tax=OCS116 cluster bacterium TaxID=2030921 RepID=A0A2A4Z3A3_9PROT